MIKNGGIQISKEDWIKADTKTRDSMMYDFLQVITKNGVCQIHKCKWRFRRIWIAILILFVIVIVGTDPTPPWFLKGVSLF